MSELEEKIKNQQIKAGVIFEKVRDKEIEWNQKFFDRKTMKEVLIIAINAWEESDGSLSVEDFVLKEIGL